MALLMLASTVPAYRSTRRANAEGRPTVYRGPLASALALPLFRVVFRARFETVNCERGIYPHDASQCIMPANQLSPRTISAARSNSIDVSLLQPTNFSPRPIRNLAC